MGLHILQLGPVPPPEGGISRNLLAIRDAALERGDTCSIIATSRSTEQANDQNIHYPRSAIALLKLLAGLKFDVLHLHIGGDVGRRVMLLALAVTIFGLGKSVLTLHSGGFPESTEGKAAKPMSFRGFVFRRFARIIAVNEQLTAVFRRYGVQPDRISVIEPFSPKQPDKSIPIPDKLADFFASHSPVLLAVGGLERDYDPLFQIHALNLVLQDFSNAGLMIVGDGSMRAEVENAAAKSGYLENICIAGNVKHDVTLRLIADADILLRTTLFDGDAISVREALFLGTPVIATDNGMRPDGVYLIPMQDAAALAVSVERIAANGKGRVGETPPAANNIHAILDIYSRMS